MDKSQENSGKTPLPEIKRRPPAEDPPDVTRENLQITHHLQIGESERPPEKFKLEKVYGRLSTFFVNLVRVAYPRIASFLRFFWPVVPLGRVRIVLRYDDVQEVLQHDDDFVIPFEHKGEKLGWKPNFLLGMQDGDDYQRIKRDVFRIFALDDIENIVKPKSWQFANDILDREGGKIDAIGELVARVPTLIVEDYYGIRTIDDRKEFEDCLIAISGYFFGSAGKAKDPLPDYAKHAFGIFRHTVESSVNARIQNPADLHLDILGRLMLENGKDPDWMTRDRIVSYMLGMILGFLPTNLMANGNLLEVLFRDDRAFKISRQAAENKDDELLNRCLLEALRMSPINPGPWRWCAQNYTLSPHKTRWDRIVRRRRIKEGRVVLASTQSAMMDKRRVSRPKDFDPDRSNEHYMNYGHGLHWCVGKYIANAQITQTMKALLKQEDLRPAPGGDGKLRRISMFPRTMYLEYKP